MAYSQFTYWREKIDDLDDIEAASLLAAPLPDSALYHEAPKSGRRLIRQQKLGSSCFYKSQKMGNRGSAPTPDHKSNGKVCKEISKTDKGERKNNKLPLPKAERNSRSTPPNDLRFESAKRDSFVSFKSQNSTPSPGDSSSVSSSLFVDVQEQFLSPVEPEKEINFHESAIQKEPPTLDKPVFESCSHVSVLDFIETSEPVLPRTTCESVDEDSQDAVFHPSVEDVLRRGSQSCSETPLTDVYANNRKESLSNMSPLPTIGSVPRLDSNDTEDDIYQEDEELRHFGSSTHSLTSRWIRHSFQPNSGHGCSGVSSSSRNRSSSEICLQTASETQPQVLKRYRSQSFTVPNGELRRVSSLTLNKATLAKYVKKPKDLPQKLDFRAYEKFQGQMLVNWFCSSFTDDNPLSRRELRIMAAQFCTNLVCAGVLRRIDSSNSETVFQPDELYQWSKSESPNPASGRATPRRLSPTAWPHRETTPPASDKEVGTQLKGTISQEELDNPSVFHFESSSLLGDYQDRVARLELQLEKYRTLTEIEKLTSRRSRYQSSPATTRSPCASTQTEPPRPTLSSFSQYDIKSTLLTRSRLVQTESIRSWGRSVQTEHGSSFMFASAHVQTDEEKLDAKRLSRTRSDALASFTPFEQKELCVKNTASTTSTIFPKESDLTSGGSSTHKSTFCNRCANLSTNSTACQTDSQESKSPSISASTSECTIKEAKRNSVNDSKQALSSAPQISLSSTNHILFSNNAMQSQNPTSVIQMSQSIKSSTLHLVSSTIPPMPGCGPPPPPPMPGCGPPPPPPGFGWQPVPAAYINRKPKIAPKQPMKPLYWNRVQINYPAAKEKYPDCLWENIEEAKLKCWEEFENLFSKPILQKRDSEPKKVEKTKAKEVAKLLDQKRSQNVGILISSRHLVLSEIQRALYNFDTSVVDVDVLHSIYEAKPTAEELKIISSHRTSQPDVPLDKPEQFLLDLSLIPEYSIRIECIIFHSSFKENLEAIESKLLNLTTTCDCLQGKGVQNVLSIVLAVGNYMNGGNSSRGQADGFGIEILSKLRDVKSKDNSLTLLHFVMRTYFDTFEMGKDTDDCIMPVPEPCDVDRAGAVKFDEVKKELDRLYVQTAACERKVSQILTSSDEKHQQPLKDTMQTFLKKAFAETRLQMKELERSKTTFKSTQKFFKFLPKSNNECDWPKEFFSVWSTFCQDFKDIWKRELKIRKAEKIRIDQLRKQKEKPVPKAKVKTKGLKNKLKFAQADEK